MARMPACATTGASRSCGLNVTATATGGSAAWRSKADDGKSGRRHRHCQGRGPAAQRQGLCPAGVRLARLPPG